MVWYSHLFQNFPQFIVIHTVKGFGIVNKAEIVKINKTKGWFFEKINKVDKPLARLIKKKREKNQINKIRNEKEEVTKDNAEL